MRTNMKILIVSLLALVLLAGFSLAGAKKADKTAWLGVEVETVDRWLVRDMDLPVDKGVMVEKVIKDSPADNAGLRKYDVITEFNGKSVEESDELVELINKSQPDDKIVLTVYAGDKKETIDVILGAKRSASRNSWAYVYDNKNDGDDDNYYLFSSKDHKYSYIGVSLSGLSDQLGEFFGVRDGEGALISNIVEDSPAEKAGLKAGDVIVAIEGEAVEDPSDASEMIRERKPGDRVSVEIIRDKKKKDVTVEVAESKGYNWGGYSYTVPNIDIRVPKFDKQKLREFIDQEDFNDDMDELRDDLKELREELKDEWGDDFEDEMQELRKELKQLKREIDRINSKL